MKKRATVYELIFASLLCITMNVYTHFANFFSYYLTGVVGIGTVLAGTFITIFRLWDAVTDLGIGSMVDKTNTKAGKFRPWIIGGTLLAVVSSWFLINIPAALPENTGLRLFVFVIIYMIFVVGTTMLNPATRSVAQILTDDPKQRASVGMIRGLSLQILYSVLPIIVYSYIIPKTKGFDLEFFRIYWKIVTIIVIIFSGLAYFALKNKDTCQQQVEVKKYSIKEALDVVKENRPLQMLILSAGSDKLAMVCQNNAAIVVILYAIIAGNPKLSSGAAAYTLIPCLLMIILGLGGIARKYGTKKSMIFGSWGGIIVCILSILLWIFGDPSTFNFPQYEGFQGWSFFTIAFLILWCLNKGFTLITANVTSPMIADVIDYEQYRSGKYVPGLIGSLFSFSDKVISSLGPTFVSLLIAGIGFRDQLPAIDTPYSDSLFAIGLFGMYGMVLIGLMVNIIAMRFYELTPERMEEIHAELSERQ